MRPVFRRVSALEALLPTPRPKTEVEREVAAICRHLTDDELDELEEVYRVAALLGLDGPLAADQPRVAQILERAHERRRQAREPPA